MKVTKRFNSKTKEENNIDYDKVDGIVSFYFIKFNEYDSDNDRFLQNCLEYDLDEVRYFLNHDIEKPIGNVISIDSDNYGYYATCKIIDNSLVSGIKDMYLNNLIKNHSFMGIASDYERNSEGGYDIKKIRLLEVSALTGWGANQNTEVISIKNKDISNNQNMDNMVDKQQLKVEKATESEVALLNEKISLVTESLNEVQNRLFELNNTVNSLLEVSDTQGSTDATSEDMIVSESSKVKQKKKKNNVLDSSLLNQIKKVSLDTKIFKKSVTFSGTGSPNISYGGYQNTRYGMFALSSLQKTIDTNSIDVTYSLVSNVTPANNTGTDCYVSNPTNINFQKYQVHLDRLVARTTYCQSEVLSTNESDFFDEIRSILENEILQTLSNTIYNQMITLGTNQTATPSWTALAGTVTTPTIYDILAIHTQDIYQLSNGKVPTEIAMVLNPADYARMLTDKITFMYVSNPVTLNIFRDVTVPVGNYVVFPMDYLKLYVYNMGEIQSALDGVRPYDGIVNVWINFYAHFALRAQNSNVVIYGNVSNALTNYQ